MKSRHGIDGPFSLEELRFLAARMKLLPDDEVRSGESDAWRPARHLNGIFNSPQQQKGHQEPSSSVRRRPRADFAAGVARSEESAAVCVPPPVGADNRPSISTSAPYSSATHAGKGSAPRSASLPTPNVVPLRSPKDSRKKNVIAAAIVGAVVMLLLLLAIIFFFGSGLAGSLASRKTGADSGGAIGQQPTEVGHSGKPNTKSSNADLASNKSTSPKVQPSQKLSGGKNAANPDRGSATASGDGTSSKHLFGTADFFGIVADGSTFIYVVDCSWSMSGAPFAAAKQELTQSIQKLLPDQYFYVIFFSSDAFPMFSPGAAAPKPLPADNENVRHVTQWIEIFSVTGGTDPESAMLQALDLRPDAIFMLTDGEFDESVVKTIARNNTRKISVHTIAFKSRGGEPLLKRIAKANSGVHRFVP